MNTKAMCINIHTGNLLLVSANFALTHEMNEQLIAPCKSAPNVLLKPEAAHALRKCLNSINASGQIVAVSGYRSAAEQTKIYTSSLKENGPEFTKSFVALPYHSEHQTALAIDLALNKAEIDFICPDFPYSGICDIFRNSCANFGFIQRYPAKKEHITGIAHEPWHFRYVGYPHSAIISKNNLTLEEYITFIKQYEYRKKHLEFVDAYNKYEIFYISASDIPFAHLPQECLISGNNADGFIVTAWRRCL